MIPRRKRDERGVALVSVIVVSLIMMSLVTATTVFAFNSLDLSRHDQDWNAALAAAEAGIDDYIYRLSTAVDYWQYSDTNPPPDPNPAFTGWAPVPGPSSEGFFRYEVDSSSTPVDGLVKVTSTGKVGTTTRTVQAGLRRKNFIDYLYFTDFETKDPAIYNTGSPDFDNMNATTAQALCERYSYAVPPRDSDCVRIVFFSQDVIRGPLHTNDGINISGSPTFLGPVSTAWDDPTGRRWLGSGTPVFSDPGDPFLSANLPLPASNTEIKALADPDQGGAGCLFTGPTEINFNANGTMDVVSPLTQAGNCAPGNQTPLPPNGVIYVQGVPTDPGDPNYDNTCPVSSGNPLGYPISGDITPGYGCFDGDVFVNGTVRGQVTVAAADTIIVNGDLRYQQGTLGSDLLGLVADNYVQVYHPVASNGAELAMFRNVTIQAAILSVKHSFIVQNYRRGTSRGTLSVTGAIAQKYRGPVGTFSGSSITTGFRKDYFYDPRLASDSPPYFLDPVVSSWQVVTWAEVSPEHSG